MNIYENIEKETEVLYSILKKQQSMNSKEFEEDKNKLMQEYNLTMEEIEMLIGEIEHGFSLYQEGLHDYNNGDIYYDDSIIEYEKEKLEKSIRVYLKKYISRQRISKIRPDEITPELVEELMKNGYDGTTGHPVLQSYFKMYLNVQEGERKSRIDKERIATLKEQSQKMEDTIELLTTRDTELQEYISTQNGYFDMIKQQMGDIKQKSEEIKPKLRAKSLGERIKRFFRRDKAREITEIQEYGLQMEEENTKALYYCYQAEGQNNPRGIEAIKREQQKSGIIPNNIYDSIVSPVANNRDLLDLINVYATLKDNDQLNQIYNYMVSEHEGMTPEEVKEYNERFFSFSVKPAVLEMSEKIKSGTYVRTDNTFVHLYSKEDMYEMFKEKGAEEILARGREIESRNKKIFDSLNPIFWKNGDKDRRQLYINFLEEHDIHLNKEELLEWMDYRAVMEEFQNPKLMGFHMRRTIRE